MKRISGECFCGQAKYEITGPLVDPIACHCSRCRKAFSAQSSNYARVTHGNFDWIQGREHLNEYAGDNGFGWLFCEKCGSTLCGIVNDEIHGVVLGCLNDDPEIDEIHHIFVDSKARWEVMPDNTTQFRAGRKPEDRRG